MGALRRELPLGGQEMRTILETFFAIMVISACLGCGAGSKADDGSLPELERTYRNMALWAYRLQFNSENFFPLPKWVLDAPRDVQIAMGLDHLRERARRSRGVQTQDEIDKALVECWLIDDDLRGLSRLFEVMSPEEYEARIGDPFSKKGERLRYIAWTGPEGFPEELEADFMIISCGPDGDKDIDLYECAIKGACGGLEAYLDERTYGSERTRWGDGDIYLRSVSHLGWRILRSGTIPLSPLSSKELRLREKEEQTVDELVRWAAVDWYREAETRAGR